MNRPDALIRVLPPFLHWSSDGEVRVAGRRIGLFHIVKGTQERRVGGNDRRGVRACARSDRRGTCLR